MRKIEDYLKHAEECRTMARKTPAGEHRDQLMNMAATWDALAVERQRKLRIGLELTDD
jgi:hypothetical protein